LQEEKMVGASVVEVEVEDDYCLGVEVAAGAGAGTGALYNLNLNPVGDEIRVSTSRTSPIFR
jgi:hypothetical protein